MKINRYYLKKSLFIMKSEILNNKKIQQEFSEKPQKAVKNKLSLLPEYRSMLNVKRYKPTPNGNITEDIKEAIKEAIKKY